MNVENQPLVEPSKILLLSMHFKPGMIKNFVKAMNQEEAAFTYLQEELSLVHKYKTLSRTYTSTGSFKATRWLRTVLNIY